MDDLISRQEAIDFVDAGHLCNPNEPRWSDNDVVNFLESRPPAQQWIPCSERLPKLDNSYPNSKEYLTQWDDGRIDITRYSNVNIFWQNEITEPYWKGEQCSKVIAWMPLPKPYKGGTDNDYERAVEQMENDMIYEPSYNQEDGSM